MSTNNIITSSSTPSNNQRYNTPTNVIHPIPQPDLLSLPSGLSILYDVLSPQEEQSLIAEIDGYPWNSNLARRTMHFGYIFDYSIRQAVPVPNNNHNNNNPLCEKNTSTTTTTSTDHESPPHHHILPKFAITILQRLSFNPTSFQQLTINEYLPGQGIASHIDTHSCFGDTIISLSLSSGCVMKFKNCSEQQQQYLSIYLPPRSILIMSDEIRFVWEHAIPNRKTDLINGMIIPRNRRISLTFRSIREKGICTCIYKHVCDSQDYLLKPTRLANSIPLPSSIDDNRTISTSAPTISTPSNTTINKTEQYIDNKQQEQ
jgi:alkylated DNA repair dioxygenase AlkB